MPIDVKTPSPKDFEIREIPSVIDKKKLKILRRPIVTLARQPVPPDPSDSYKPPTGGGLIIPLPLDTCTEPVVGYGLKVDERLIVITKNMDINWSPKLTTQWYSDAEGKVPLQKNAPGKIELNKNLNAEIDMTKKAIIYWLIYTPDPSPPAPPAPYGRPDYYYFRVTINGVKSHNVGRVTYYRGPA